MFYEAFPKELNKDLQEVFKVIPMKTYNNISTGYSEDIIEYYLNGNIIKIPYRIYFADAEISKKVDLTDTQKEILCCIYTRSCDGYIRGKIFRST